MTAPTGDTSSSKTQLRREFRRLRAALPPPQRRHAAQQAARRLARHPLFRRARHIALYLAHGSELDTTPLMQLCHEAGKSVYVPRIATGFRMRFEPLPPRAALRCNRLGIREPARRSAPRALRDMDLVILPLVAFDAQGHRLGAGGGYYDRALASRGGAGPCLVGYAYALQQAAQLPVDPWDRQLDAVVTEHAFLSFRS